MKHQTKGWDTIQSKSLRWGSCQEAPGLSVWSKQNECGLERTETQQDMLSWRGRFSPNADWQRKRSLCTGRGWGLVFIHPGPKQDISRGLHEGDIGVFRNGWVKIEKGVCFCQTVYVTDSFWSLLCHFILGPCFNPHVHLTPALNFTPESGPMAEVRGLE